MPRFNPDEPRFDPEMSLTAPDESRFKPDESRSNPGERCFRLDGSRFKLQIRCFKLQTECFAPHLSSQETRVNSMIQLVSQVRPPSAERACSQRQESGVSCDQMNRAKTARPWWNSWS